MALSMIFAARKILMVSCVVAALAAALAAGGVQAQDNSAPLGELAPQAAPPPMASELPAPVATSNGYIALLYYRLTGQMPDFDAWAMASDDYIAANSFDKELVKREKAQEAERAYHLVTLDEPLVIKTDVTLSSYSRSKQGFFVENFRPDTFFEFSFIGRNYAVVPLDLMDFQWLAVNDPAVQARLENVTKSNAGKATMFIYITPSFADKQTPLKIDNKEYWLLSGRVQRLAVYDHRARHLLWEGFGKSHVEQQQQEVLDLYK